MLYSLRTGKVASKPRAATWMLEATGTRWADLVHSAAAGLHETGAPSDRSVRDMLSLIDFVADEYQQWISQA
jgi:hypothetical protein